MAELPGFLATQEKNHSGTPDSRLPRLKNKSAASAGDVLAASNCNSVGARARVLAGPNSNPVPTPKVQRVLQASSIGWSAKKRRALAASSAGVSQGPRDHDGRSKVLAAPSAGMLVAVQVKGCRRVPSKLKMSASVECICKSAKCKSGWEGYCQECCKSSTLCESYFMRASFTGTLSKKC